VLERRLEHAQAALVLGLYLSQRRSGELQAGRLERGKHGVEHHLIDTARADLLAGAARPVSLAARAHVYAGRLPEDPQ